jgi:hypothetical protein
VLKKLLFIILFLSFAVNANAALTKAVESVDTWAEVTAGTVREGATTDLSPNYQTNLCIDVSLSEATAETIGATIVVQISSNTTGDADWIVLTTLGGPTGTGISKALGGTEAVGQTVLSVDNPATANLNHHGKLLFIENTTPANSELVYSVSDSGDAGDTITVQDGLTTEQTAAASTIWSIDGTASAIAQYVVNIPDTAYRVRVLYDNINSTGADIFTRARITKMTGI